VPFISISVILAEKLAVPVVCALVERGKAVEEQTAKKTSVTKIRKTEERVYIRIGRIRYQTEQRVS
jgi:hypothetical protein